MGSGVPLVDLLADGSGTSGHTWFWICVIPFVIGFIGSEFAPWKSTRLSPESIKRRFYWAGVGGFLVCLFWSQLPDWKDGLAGVGLFFFSFVTLAFFRSSHIKFGARIIAAWPSYRRPDHPPALRRDDRG
jgi:hypothetical protein